MRVLSALVIARLYLLQGYYFLSALSNFFVKNLTKSGIIEFFSLTSQRFSSIVHYITALVKQTYPIICFQRLFDIIFLYLIDFLQNCCQYSFGLWFYTVLLACHCGQRIAEQSRKSIGMERARCGQYLSIFR